ncbi:redoxin domain-containing protein [Phocaeicola sp.]
MKKLLLVIGMALPTLWGTAQTRTIDYPVKGKRTTEALEFYQVTVSDTAVIVKGNMYSRPNYWVKLASSSVLKGKTTGKNYRLVRATGIKLDKEVYMPESWNRSFTLQFEPVDAKDKSVDFDELLPDGEGFVVNGIALEAQPENKKIHCRIEGKVINDVACSRMMLLPEGTDARVNEWVSIPVYDGKFSYDLYADEENAYTLIPWNNYMGGMMFTTDFFAENGVVEPTFYSMEKQPELTSDSPLNKELLTFKQETNRLFMAPLQMEREKLEKEGKLESPEMQALRKQFEEVKDEAEKGELRKKINQLYQEGKAFTPEYEALNKKSKEVFEEYQAYTLEYIKENPTLIGFYLLKNQAQRMRQGMEMNPEPYVKVYNEVYAQKFPNHSMSEYMQNWVSSQGIKVGEQFIDFTAPDLAGIRHTLSEEIAGKVALIDLWASWCGPCRRTSMSMIPLYEAYKDKGFTIVGVARERKKADMESALAKDKYPWLNLLELNDNGKIWEKYGVGNGGGCTFLIDKDGKILAIHPTAEEVKTILDKLLDNK